MRKPAERWEIWLAQPMTDPEELAAFILDEENDSVEYKVARKFIYQGAYQPVRSGSNIHLLALLKIPELQFVAEQHYGWLGAKLRFARQVYNYAVRFVRGMGADAAAGAAIV